MSIAWEFTVIDYTVLVGIVIILVLALVVGMFARKNRLPSEIDRKFFRERWRKIQELMGYGKEMNYKLAVIEADKLLDEALKVMFFTGATMAERLKLASYKFPRLKKVWWAHKVRNQIVHNVRYDLKHGEARKVLKLFKDALSELKVI
ncbi:hypothetical protein HN858_02390 [Candidatus Falkowbacteria bacterium]|jgi:hypothetical protein|nr:hypothetical protein [Candidatus Falkowbacteria bacterium]MBT5503205.1 hypothetical protein [Candidatus Falkowbacteria bacterium]MBT6573888.1 hypothetical protein [Candidatus Falkowbacteria bacterium]MBT7348505.1 hypothetical protein [Candidatus Falkowbacteria bacterium]MBT7500830.1 hypothetical protein [Candidatus Falkowbacteria bacterium]